MKYIQTLPFFIVSIAFSLTTAAFAGGSDPDMAPVSKHENGTNVKGESSDFKQYLNEGKKVKESNSIDLVELGEDAKVAAGGDDTSLGVRMGY